MNAAFAIARATSLSLVLTAAAVHAQAEGVGPAQGERVDNRQMRQEQRIDQGIESGGLTRPEAARLTRQQAHIDRMENRVEADGSVTRREALRLEHAQDRASRRIAHAKHDRQLRMKP